MYECRFELNSKPLSEFKLAARTFTAFSGLEPYVNKRVAACLPNVGPIPPGTYYIVDRESGGFLGWLYDSLGDKKDWFALYANDLKIDDEVYCEEVKRGKFRLHPKVGRGISKGCITIDSQADFRIVRSLLKGTSRQSVPGTDLLAYGRVIVK